MEPEHAVAEHAAAGPLPAFNLLGWNLDLNDPAFWAFVGLIIFIGVILYMKVPASITKSLDDRAGKITSELAAAEALRKEAEAKLAEVQKRAAEAETEAKQIVEAARREADQLAVAASAALTERIARREKMAEERITRAEAEDLLFEEADLLDQWRLEEWLALYTADARVEADIRHQLEGHGAPPLTVHRSSMDRPNLALAVVAQPGMAHKLAYLAQLVPRLPRPGLLYCATRERSELVAEYLQLHDVDAAAILARTGGHPLFIEETLADLVRRGVVGWNPAGRQLQVLQRGARTPPWQLTFEQVSVEGLKVAAPALAL